MNTNHYSLSRFRIKSVTGYLPGLASDFLRNRHCRAEANRILVTRHPAKHSSMFRDFWAWAKLDVPELVARMEFQHLPYTLSNTNHQRFSAHVSWINDTLDLWSPSGFRDACQLANHCRSNEITCINSIDRIANVGKARGAELMRNAGVRTPIAIPLAGKASITADELLAAGISLPCLIREERGHGRISEFVADADQLTKVDLSRYHFPIATEFIDTRDPVDGLYRKYRYVSAGEVGVPRHMITDRQWDVRPHRRVKEARVLEQEAEYIRNPDPNHEQLQAARDTLGMDLVGFDYSFTPNRELVIWEANPYLDMNAPKHVSNEQLGDAVSRTFAAVAHLYLRSAGVEIPFYVQSLLTKVATFDSTTGAKTCNR